MCSELALVDVAGDKLRAEKMDLADGQAFMKHRIRLSADTGSLADSPARRRRDDMLCPSRPFAYITAALSWRMLLKQRARWSRLLANVVENMVLYGAGLVA